MQIEQAGGMGSTGTMRILDITPQSIHQRVPTFIGSRETIEELCEYMRGEAGEAKGQMP